MQYNPLGNQFYLTQETDLERAMNLLGAHPHISEVEFEMLRYRFGFPNSNYRFTAAEVAIVLKVPVEKVHAAEMKAATILDAHGFKRRARA